MTYSFYTWEQEGHTLIPNYFLKYLVDFGLSDQETLALILLMSPLTRPEQVDTRTVLSQMTGWTPNEVETILNNLALKQYIRLDMIIDAHQGMQERYSLEPLFKQIEMKIQFADIMATNELTAQSPVIHSTNHSKSHSSSTYNEDIFQLFQQTFGRNLSALELEKINAWMTKDQYPTDLIRLALREAAVRQALTVNYVDKILLNWEKQNIRTVAAAEQALSTFDSRQQLSKVENNINHDLYKQIIIPDWTE